MADFSHLERMGRELKCPICLSLFNSAVSLTCNHVFCNSCIQKSMKSNSCCPVCKVPSSRREVRPAPHMENLVQIYKSMEMASGMNISVTQNAPPTKSSDKEKAEGGSISRKKECGTKGIKSRRASKSKLKSPGTKPVRPSFRTNKRVQVPKTPLPETPIALETSEPEGGAMNCVPNSDVPNYTTLNGNSNHLLRPLFWLREEDVEKLSQSTNKEHLTLTPVDVPNFSDIKDSDDDTPEEVSLREVVSAKHNVEGLFDSEMFVWSQRAGSPELCSTPTRIQGPSSYAKGSSNKVLKTCSKGCTDRRVTKEIVDKINSSEKSSSENDDVIHDSVIKILDKASERHESRKRTRNGRMRTQSKGTKISQANAAAALSVKETIVDQGCVPQCHLDQLEEAVNQVEKTFSIAPCTEKAHGKNRTLRNRTNSKSYQCQKKLQEKSALLKSSSPNLDPIREVRPSQQKDCEGGMSSKSSTVALVKKKSSIRVDNGCATPMGGKSRKCKRKIDVSSNVGLNKQGDTDMESHDVTANSTGPHYSMKAGSVIPKCHSYKRICGFCHSAEETEFSGEMIDYVQGKPVSSNFVGGSSIIHSHKNCTEWAPNVYFQDDTAIDLEAELTRSRRIKCSLCCEKGAALGCYDTSCRRSFHVPCAKRLKQSRWDTDNFVMLCPLHASTKLPNEQAESQVKRKNNPKCAKSQSAINHGTETSLWDSRGYSEKLHLCFSALTTGEKEVVTKFKRLSGASVSKNWNTCVTHVIASTDENGACKRTLKVMMGILEGKWILSIEWVKACLNAKKVVDESTYEINAVTHGIKGGPRLGRLRRENKQAKIFAGLSFYLCGDFEPSYRGYLNDLIISAGGNILHRKPIVDDEGNMQEDDSTIIVYSMELANKNDANKDTILKARQMEAEGLAKTSGSISASNLWLLDCISGYKLLPLQSSMI